MHPALGTCTTCMACCAAMTEENHDCLGHFAGPKLVLTAEERQVLDTTPDAEFYATPRMVQHADEAFIGRLTGDHYMLTLAIRHRVLCFLLVTCMRLTLGTALHLNDNQAKDAWCALPYV